MSDDLDRVRTLICTIGNLESIGADQDFYEAGFSSIRALQLLMDMEDALGVSIPDDRFVTARTARALHEVVIQLRKGGAR